jgi:sterol desaturase/sphingolipid hydroxylase (fatty acid hydroxylase superfamily)
MTAPITLLALALTGAVLWSFGEYLLHRFVMHERRGRGLASREHLRHHAERDSILELWYLAWSGVVIVGGLLALVAALAIGPTGVAVGAGWVAAYGFYDWLHYRAHRRPIRHPYERWLRRHHFHHHFGHPLANHGVTSPFWDLVFGTYERPAGPVRVPRRLAMVWLLDAAGEVRPEHRRDYEVVGGRSLDDRQADQDRVRAFANLAPET